MTNKVNILRFLRLTLAVAGFVVVSGSLIELSAQNRDPFSKPGWARERKPAAPGGPVTGKVNGPPVNLGAPGIEQRIEFYKRMRETAATGGQPIPKVTSVLTLNEMAVTGIFRTPRGYAAMVEAEPLKLSYTVYPGEKFFDGQLVAVEENRLIFRRVVKMSNGKFVSSVENKPLRKYSDREVVQGTAPTQGDNLISAQPTPAAQPTETQVVGAKPAVPVISPLDEMNRQVPEASSKDKPKSKKSVKVAKSN